MKMKQFVPLGKQSKKAQREFNRVKRTMWEMNPVSRVKESRKIYSRSRAKKETREFL